MHRGRLRFETISVYAALLSLGFVACLDTKLIPAEPRSQAGEGAESGRATAGAAEPMEGGDGGSRTAQGGAPQGGSNQALSGDAGDASSSAGQPSMGGDSGITWLSLEGSEAPRTSGANASLGISGLFYGYTDGCADLSWDAASRCASGTLCEPAGGENWGIAVGFDLNNTGATGSPPDTKLIWNPQAFGVRGFAFRVHGSAPGLQLWVLNMDSTWQGQCSAMTCEIAGPPDGLASAPLEGELLFDAMVKDYWGGAGTPYEFDPAAVHALQFKLPAINVGAASFNFCIDALGVVR